MWSDWNYRSRGPGVTAGWVAALQRLDVIWGEQPPAGRVAERVAGRVVERAVGPQEKQTALQALVRLERERTTLSVRLVFVADCREG